MDMKPSLFNTLKKSVPNAKKLSKLDDTHLTSSLNEILEYLAWLKLKVDLLAQTGQKCNESCEVTLNKISEFLSSEINLFAKALKLDTVNGAQKTISSMPKEKQFPNRGLAKTKTSHDDEKMDSYDYFTDDLYYDLTRDRRQK